MPGPVSCNCCRHWRPLDASAQRGECRCFPPALAGKGWPVTSLNQTCGQFAASKQRGAST